jgi:hypothetical protein
VTDQIAEKVYEIIEQLEEQRGKPPTWMQVRQYFDKEEVRSVDGFDEIHRHPFIKAAVYWKDRVFMTPCLNYCSMNQWGPDFLTFT